MRSVRFLLRTAVLWLLAPAAAAAPTLLELGSRTISYGSQIVLEVSLRYAGNPCPADLNRDINGRLSVAHNGREVPADSSLRWWLHYRSCSGNGEYTARNWLWLRDRYDMGEHVFVATYHGDPGLDASTSSPVTVNVAPEYLGSVPGGSGPIAAGLANTGRPGTSGGAFCERGPGALSFTAVPANASPPPAGMSFPHGFVDFSVMCRYECGFPICPPAGSLRAEQILQLRYPGVVPPGSQLWAYIPHNGDPTPQWRPLPTVVEGQLVTATLQGGYLQSAPTMPSDPWLRGSVALAAPVGSRPQESLQDAWWGGPSENGWGVSIAQRDDRLFVTLSIYAGDGRPAWLIMPTGAWDPTRSVFSGSLYQPHSPRALGAAAGFAALVFHADGTATLSYAIHGASGTKTLERLAFGPPTGRTAPQAGVWDLMAEGTGGLTVHRRGDALFGTWLGYAAQGPGEWLVMPGGAWSSSDTFTGTLYRTRGAPWIGTGYDAGRLRVSPVGSLTIRFTSPDDGEVAYTIDGLSGTSRLRRHPF